MIPRIRVAATEMPLVIEEGYTATLRKRLRNGELDVILISLPFNEPDVVTQVLYEEPFVVLMPKQHPLASKKSVSTTDLIQHDVLLLGEGHCFRDQILDSCSGLRQSIEENRSSVRTAAEGSSLETLRHMVASDLGVTVVPKSAADVSQYKDCLLYTSPSPRD